MNENQTTHKPIDHWIMINQMLGRQRIICLFSYLLSALMGIGLLVLALDSPVVIEKSGETSQTVYSQKAWIDSTKRDLEEVAKEFILARYVWNELDPVKISANTAPLTTLGANEKFRASLDRDLRPLSGKSTRQMVTDLKILTSEEKIAASFYRVIEIEGVAVAAKTNLSFQFVTGPRTKWNPSGLYVNGVIEFSGEGSK